MDDDLIVPPSFLESRLRGCSQLSPVDFSVFTDNVSASHYPDFLS